MCPPRAEIWRRAAIFSISPRGGTNTVPQMSNESCRNDRKHSKATPGSRQLRKTNISFQLLGRLPCGSNGDDSEAWLHHWLLPVAEQTWKLGKLRDFLEIFLSPGSLLPQRVPEPEFSNFLGPFGPRWTRWTRNFARFLQPPRSCRMVKISLSIKEPESPPKKEPLAMVTARGRRGCPCYASA